MRSLEELADSSFGGVPILPAAPVSGSTVFGEDLVGSDAEGAALLVLADGEGVRLAATGACATAVTC